MSNFKIYGGRKLKGSIDTNTSKNGAINMMVAALINYGETILHDIPKIEEVYRYKELIESMNVEVSWLNSKTKKVLNKEEEKNIENLKDFNSLKIKIKKDGINLDNLNVEVANKIRSFTFVGALVHRFKTFNWPNSGGCKMGERTVSAHKYGLEHFGVSIVTKENHYEISRGKLQNAPSIAMYESSDTGAINLLIAASRIKGKSIIKFAPQNYQVLDVVYLLQKFGVKIKVLAANTFEVEGVERINKKIEHYNSEDPIDAMFFISSAIVTNSTLNIQRAPIEFLELELEKLKRVGVKFSLSKKYLAKNKKTNLVDITILERNKKENLLALHDKVHTGAYPAIQNDNLPFFVPIATLAEGITLIHDWTWENRAIYFMELNRLGADMRLADPHRVFVNGVKELKGNDIVCPPALRPAAIILVAMLAAKGESTLYNVYSIKRGYQDIVERLNSIGAKVESVKD